MRRRSYERLIDLQRRHASRAFELEERDYRSQAARSWAALGRVTRALEARRAVACSSRREVA